MASIPTSTQCPMTPRSYTHELIDFVLDVQPRDVTGDARRTVDLAFADTIGCALAGSNSDEASIAGDVGGAPGRDRRIDDHRAHAGGCRRRSPLSSTPPQPTPSTTTTYRR